MKFVKKLNKVLKSQDLFGYQVQLHFGTFLDKEENGDPIYKTSIGGCISLFIYGLLGYFVYYFFYIMIENTNN